MSKSIVHSTHFGRDPNMLDITVVYSEIAESTANRGTSEDDCKETNGKIALQFTRELRRVAPSHSPSILRQGVKMKKSKEHGYQICQ